MRASSSSGRCTHCSAAPEAAARRLLDEDRVFRLLPGLPDLLRLRCDGGIEAVLPGIRSCASFVRRQDANVPRRLALGLGLLVEPSPSAPPTSAPVRRRLDVGRRRQFWLGLLRLWLRLGLSRRRSFRNRLGFPLVFLPRRGADDGHRVRGLLRLLEGSPAERLLLLGVVCALRLQHWMDRGRRGRPREGQLLASGEPLDRAHDRQCTRHGEQDRPPREVREPERNRNRDEEGHLTTDAPDDGWNPFTRRGQSVAVGRRRRPGLLRPAGCPHRAKIRAQRRCMAMKRVDRLERPKSGVELRRVPVERVEGSLDAFLLVTLFGYWKVLDAWQRLARRGLGSRPGLWFHARKYGLKASTWRSRREAVRGFARAAVLTNPLG